MPATLKVYVIADVHSSDNFIMPEMDPTEIDLVLTLGDIDPDTIDYILGMSRKVKVFGVLGNHDPERVPGLENLHRRVVEFKGVRIGGFSGAIKYKDHPNHFKQKEVAKWMKRMPPADLVITHSPPLSTSKDEDSTHAGFQAFDDYIQRYSPQHWFHGHLEKNYESKVGETTVHGISGKRPFILAFEISSPKDQNENFLGKIVG